MRLISSPPGSHSLAEKTAGAYRHLLAANRPVAVFFNGLGDHLLTLPALRALAALFPNRLSLACLPMARQLFFGDLSAASFIDVPLIATGQGVSFDSEMLAARIGPCDLLLFLNRALPAPASNLIQLVSPDASIGLFSAFTHPIPFPPGVHSADLAFRIPRSLDRSLTIDAFLQPLGLPGPSVQTAKDLRAMLPDGCRLLAVHTETLPEKVWPRERFQSVLNQFLAEFPHYWTVVIDKQDSELRGERIIPCCGLPLRTAFAIVSQADCFLGVDSCFLHAADLFQVPGIGLFGPTTPEEFGFRFSSGVNLRSGNTIDAISEGRVLEALKVLAITGDRPNLVFFSSTFRDF